MSRTEGLIFSGSVQLTTDFGEEKLSTKGTPFRAALARDGRGTSYRLFAFSGAPLRQIRNFSKGDAADVLGEVLPPRGEVIGLALRDISSHESDEGEDMPF